MGFPFSTTARRAQHVGEGTRLQQAMPRQKASRRRRFTGKMEQLEVRALLTGVTLSGNIFVQLDVAGLFPSQLNPPSGSFLAPVKGASVQLDGQTPIVSTDGTFSFSDVGPGQHTVSISQLPSGYVGFGVAPGSQSLPSSQSLRYTLTIPQDTSSYAPPTLNFQLETKNQAVVQNLYELVLSRPADLDGFDQELNVLNTGGSVGQVFNDLYTSSEFQEESQPIAYLAQAFFPGPLDVAAFRESVQLQNLGTAQDATVLQMLYSQPFLTKYGDISKLSNSAYINFMYQHLLNRSPTASELKTWVALLGPRPGGKAPLANRGDLPVSLVDSTGFATKRPGVVAQAGVSLAYLGVLGREPSPTELASAVSQVEAGTSIEQIASQLAQGSEYQTMTGYTSTFYWDVQTNQIPPTVTPLSRLEKFNPTGGPNHTGAFDIPVTAGSIKSSTAKGKPVDAYFLVHGWAPGLTQSELLNSTPGDPQKWWNTDDSPWLLNSVTPVSTIGLAKSILHADKNAQVFAYSWIDQSATPSGSIATVRGNLTSQSDVVRNVNTANLAVGMGVTGPGIPANAYIAAVGDNSITLSAKASATITAALTVETSQFTFKSQVTNGSAVVTGVDTTRLVAGMTVSGLSTMIPANTTIASIDGPTQITLSANASASGTAALTFVGQNLVYQTQNGTTSGSTITGLNTSNLSSGMTVTGNNIPAGDVITSIVNASEVTLYTAATTNALTPLVFKGTNLATLVQQDLYAGQSESYTQQNGQEMAQAIHLALAPNFFTYTSPDGHVSTGGGLIHILGHSHGSKVATIAAPDAAAAR